MVYRKVERNEGIVARVVYRKVERKEGIVTSVYIER